MQQLVPLESGRSLLKLTWASFWRPSGERIHRAAGSGADGTWGVMPDPGFQRTLTPDEYAAYRKYRVDRDILGLRQRQSPAENGEPNPTADFVDEQLQMAVNYLRDELDK